MTKTLLKRTRTLVATILFVAVLAFQVVGPNTISAAPTVAITSPTPGQVLPDGDFTVTGTATANTTVVVYQGSVPLGSTISNGSGAWSVAVTGLSDGATTLSAKAIQNPETAYYGALSSDDFTTATMNSIDLSDNSLNDGGQVPASLPYLLVGGQGVNSSYGYFLTGSGTTPARFDLNNPADPETVTGGYPGGGTPGTRWGAYSQDGSTWYGPNQDTDNVTVVNVGTNSIDTNIGGIDQPINLSVAPNGDIYVSYIGPSSPNQNDIMVIDGETNTIDRSIPSTCGTSQSTAQIIHSNRGYFYVLCTPDSTIKKFNTSTDALVETFDLSATLDTVSSVLLSLDEKQLIVTDSWNDPVTGRIAFVDADTGAVNDTVDTAADLFAPTLTPDGQYLYASLQGPFDGTPTSIEVINTSTLNVTTLDTSGAGGIPGIVFMPPGETTVATVAFVIGADAVNSNSDSLADTGTSKIILSIIAGSSMLAALMLVVLRKRQIV